MTQFVFLECALYYLNVVTVNVLLKIIIQNYIYIAYIITHIFNFIVPY